MSKYRHNRMAFRRRRRRGNPEQERPQTGSLGPGEPLCERCLKPQSLCVCADVVPIQTRLKVLILQHPQEPKETLGTARIAVLALPNAKVEVGLSWRNLSAALGEDTEQQKWGVLFLGTVKSSKVHASAAALPPVTILSSKGKTLEGAVQEQVIKELAGIVALDGNWRQAKALWWRNPWLLKLKRVVLNPGARSLYGADRKEPRAESLSTLEAVALSLSYFEKRPEIEEELLKPFRSLLRRYRDEP